MSDNNETKPNPTPTGKVTIATAASALVLLIVWVLSFWDITVTNEAQGAATVLLVFITGYLFKDRRSNGN